MPLQPEFIVPQDGHDKQDCESRAARRWLATHGQSYARLKPIFLGDDLYFRKPVCGAVHAAGGNFLFVCKPSSHPTIQEYLSGIELPELTQQVKRGRERFTHTYRWLCDVFLRGDADAMTVNWLMIKIRDASGKVTYSNSFITDLPAGRDNVIEMAACGRARWKIENEGLHNFGHGKLSAAVATLNLLAFAFRIVADLTYDLWYQAVSKTGARSRFFERMRSITVFVVFRSWTDLLTTVAFASQLPQLPKNACTHALLTAIAVGTPNDVLIIGCPLFLVNSCRRGDDFDPAPALVYCAASSRDRPAVRPARSDRRARIIAEAKLGERDPARLRAAALAPARREKD